MTVSAAIELLLQFALAAGKLSALIADAKARGEDTLSDADLENLQAENTTASIALQTAINIAKSEGR
jgi:hypothetical protein